MLHPVCGLGQFSQITFPFLIIGSSPCGVRWRLRADRCPLSCAAALGSRQLYHRHELSQQCMNSRQRPAISCPKQWAPRRLGEVSHTIPSPPINHRVGACWRLHVSADQAKTIFSSRCCKLLACPRPSAVGLCRCEKCSCVCEHARAQRIGGGAAIVWPLKCTIAPSAHASECTRANNVRKVTAYQ